MDRQSYERLSFQGQDTSMQQAIKVIFDLSYQKAGDQQNHLNFTHDKLVVNCKWLSQSAFKEIRELCWNLPGPTTLQIVITIVVLKTKSLAAGIKCFFIYNAISWCLFTVLTLVYLLFLNGSALQLSQEGELVLMGCNAAAAGIMVRSVVTFFSQFWGNWPKIGLIVISTGMFLASQSLGGLMGCIGLGAVVSLYLPTGSKKKMNLRTQNLFKNISNSPLLGRNSILLLVLVLIIFWIYFSIYPQSSFIYLFGFYLVGCLIVGPIQSIFAYFLAIFFALPSFYSPHLWIGLPLAFLLPGTHINVGIFYGAMIDGVRGAVLALVCLYVPCFLSLWGLLPEWRVYRDREGVRRLYEGLACATTGLAFGVIILTLKYCVTYDYASTFCIFVVSIFLNYMMTKYSFSIVLIGGFLAYMRHISLICYRKGIYCPFPFNF